jgi:hypothetical protein
MSSFAHCRVGGDDPDRRRPHNNGSLPQGLLLSSCHYLLGHFRLWRAPLLRHTANIKESFLEGCECLVSCSYEGGEACIPGYTGHECAPVRARACVRVRVRLCARERERTSDTRSLWTECCCEFGGVESSCSDRGGGPPKDCIEEPTHVAHSPNPSNHRVPRRPPREVSHSLLLCGVAFFMLRE